ncbi:MAG TPA: NAD(P)H-binding protein [Ktedonobacteraceae bacterium]|nr:NAD(P)H-binding protein [Ktedonobacteraceae bacterium]
MQYMLVTGGTGTLGHQVIPQLRNAGYKVQVLSRNSHEAEEGIEYVVGDLTTGEGVKTAVEGAELIIHCAGSSKGDEEKARNLIQAASEARVRARHLIYISVVGADRVPVVGATDRNVFGYFAAKRAAERLVINSGLPWTILRATQFHDLMFTVAEALVKMPVMPVFAGFRYQPVDAGDVAERLVQLALGEPAGLVSDIGGPRVYTQADLMRSYLHARQKHRLILPVWLPGQAARAHRAGANLALDHADGRHTWEEFLANRLALSGVVPT